MTERQRILLAELEPNIPANPVYATWSPTDRHADIALSGGNLTAQKSTIHAGNWACVRGTTSMRVGQHYWETQVNFTGTADFAAGIVDNAGLDEYEFPPGGLPDLWHSIGGPRRNGDCYDYGAPRANTGAVPSGAIVRHWLNLDAGFYRVAVNGGVWVSVVEAPQRFTRSIEQQGGWFPTVGFLRPPGSTCFVTANFGATPFLYAVPAGARPGVYTVPASTRRSIYLSNTGFKTAASEAPASTYYDGRLAGDSDIEFTREIGLSAWGTSGSARGGELSVINRDGGIDEWLAWEWRDAPFRLYSGYEGDPRSAFQLWSAGVCDRIEGIDNRRMRIVLADPLARLDVPVQNALWSDASANPILRGKPYPIVLGRPRWCEPQRVDPSPVTRNYVLFGGASPAGYSIAIDSVTDAYDKGNRFAGPSDPYTANNPIRLDNGGAFTTWANDTAGISMPAGFTRLTGFSTGDRFEQHPTALGTMRMLSTGQLTTGIYHSTSSLLAGYRYTIAFTVTALTTAGNITFRLDDGTVRTDTVVAISGTGARTATIDCLAPAQLRLLLGGTQLNATIDNLTVSSVQIIDWTYYTVSLARVGITLANKPEGKVTCHPIGIKETAGLTVVEKANHVLQYLKARAAAFAGVDFAWDTTASPLALESAAAVRMATYLTTPTTYVGLLRQIMDSLLAGLWTTRAGRVAVQRWNMPDPSAAVLTLNETNVVGDVVVSLDQAKNLRRRVAGRRNHAVHSDGDIAGSVSDALRAELTAEWGSTANGASAADAVTDVALSAAYKAASDRDALPTLLQEDADIQSLADALCTLWRESRCFYDLSAVLDADAADALEPGQTVRLVWSRLAGLAGGIPLRVVRVRTRFFSRRVDLRLWGNPPPKMAS